MIVRSMSVFRLGNYCGYASGSSTIPLALLLSESEKPHIHNNRWHCSRLPTAFFNPSSQPRHLSPEQTNRPDTTNQSQYISHKQSIMQSPPATITTKKQKLTMELSSPSATLMLEPGQHVSKQQRMHEVRAMKRFIFKTTSKRDWRNAPVVDDQEEDDMLPLVRIRSESDESTTDSSETSSKS